MANEPEATAGGAGAAANNGAPQLALQAVYLKDCSFEAPQGPRVTPDWNPQIGLDLNTSVTTLEGDLQEVLLTVTVSAKLGEQTAFLVEVKQAGAFVMQNLGDEDFRRAVGIIAPGVLFPYVRAVVTNMVSQGGFPQLLLPPVNFEALYLANNPPAATGGATN
jgi:preprotein translocase subunit SecB